MEKHDESANIFQVSGRTTDYLAIIQVSRRSLGNFSADTSCSSMEFSTDLSTTQLNFDLTLNFGLGSRTLDEHDVSAEKFPRLRLLTWIMANQSVVRPLT